MKECHYQLLKVLQENPDFSQRELAQKIGISLGKTNYCLKALIEKGWIKVSRFRHSENKVAYAYLLTPHGVEEKVKATTDFLRRKIVEYDALEKEIEQLRSEVQRSRQEVDGMSAAVIHANSSRSNTQWNAGVPSPASRVRN